METASSVGKRTTANGVREKSGDRFGVVKEKDRMMRADPKGVPSPLQDASWSALLSKSGLPAPVAEAIVRAGFENAASFKGSFQTISDVNNFAYELLVSQGLEPGVTDSNWKSHSVTKQLRALWHNADVISGDNHHQDQTSSNARTFFSVACSRSRQGLEAIPHVARRVFFIRRISSLNPCRCLPVPDAAMWASSTQIQLKILNLGVPVIAASMLEMFSMELLTTMLVGFKGDVAEMGAMGLANVLQNCIVFSILRGFEDALDPFVASAAERQEFHLCATYLQRCRLLAMVQLFWMVPLLWNTSFVLIGFGQQESVSMHVEDYMRVNVLGLVSYFHYSLSKRFLVDLSSSATFAAVDIACSILHVLWAYIFIAELDMGVSGAAYANIVTWTLKCVLAAIYLGRLSTSLGVKPSSLLLTQRLNLEGVPAFLKVAVPATISVSSEWVFYEVTTLLVGLLGEKPLAAHVAVMTVYSCSYYLPSGFQVCCTTLTAAAIASGSPARAKAVIMNSVIVNLVCWTVFFIAIYTHCDFIAACFTTDSEVKAMLSRVLIISGAVGYIDGTQIILLGALRAIGRTLTATMVSLFVYFLVMLPTAVVSTMIMEYGIVGVCYSYIPGGVLSIIIIGRILSVTDWTDVVDSAVRKVKSEETDPLAMSPVSAPARTLAFQPSLFLQSGDEQDVPI